MTKKKVAEPKIYSAHMIFSVLDKLHAVLPIHSVEVQVFMNSSCEGSVGDLRIQFQPLHLCNTITFQTQSFRDHWSVDFKNVVQILPGSNITPLQVARLMLALESLVLTKINFTYMALVEMKASTSKLYHFDFSIS